MKKIYEKPTIDVVELVDEDIITTSAQGTVGILGGIRPGDKYKEW